MARTPLLIAGHLALGLAAPAAAQDAAETAAILSGTGQGQGAAQRTQGSAVAGALNNAASAIRTTRQGRLRAQGKARTPSHYVDPSDNDPLEGTDAVAYTTGSGATIRVSGGLRPAPKPSCTQTCPAPAPAP
jgi:hypothetical protein